MEITASSFKLRANAPEGRKAISYQPTEILQNPPRQFPSSAAACAPSKGQAATPFCILVIVTLLLTGANGFGAVTLSEPAHGSSTYMPHPHFTWVPDPDADRYDIQISRNSGFTDLADSDSIAVPRYVPLEPLAADEYWWRVRADYGDGTYGSWSAARTMTVSTITGETTILTTDSEATIRTKIANELASTPARIVFAEGTHSLELNDGELIFDLVEKKDVIIEGAGTGATLIFRNSNSGFSQFDRCENILLRNFTIDYKDANGNPLLHTAGIVVSVDTANATFVFDPLPGYRAPTDPLILNATARRWGCLMDWTVPGRLKTGARNHFQFDEAKTQDLGNGTYRLGLAASHTGDIGDFEPGDLFVKSASWNNMRLLFAYASKHITYANCTFYAGNSNPFIGHNNDSVHFLRVRSILANGRFTSNPCGAFVGLTYKTGMWVEECETEGIFDDSVNQGVQPASQGSIKIDGTGSDGVSKFSSEILSTAMSRSLGTSFMPLATHA